jgi:hypothetical protein
MERNPSINTHPNWLTLIAFDDALVQAEGRLAEAEKHIAFVEHEWGLDEERLIETRGRLAEATERIAELEDCIDAMNNGVGPVVPREGGQA